MDIDFNSLKTPDDIIQYALREDADPEALCNYCLNIFAEDMLERIFDITSSLCIANSSVFNGFECIEGEIVPEFVSDKDFENYEKNHPNKYVGEVYYKERSNYSDKELKRIAKFYSQVNKTKSGIALYEALKPFKNKLVKMKHPLTQMHGNIKFEHGRTSNLKSQKLNTRVLQE